jgi:hypothetical protein
MRQILGGAADANISFDEMRNLLKALGFSERIKGGHFIFSRDGIEEILNLQPKGSNCKPYQVKQVRESIVRNGIGVEVDE